jgi:hypothetical protein
MVRKTSIVFATTFMALAAALDAASAQSGSVVVDRPSRITIARFLRSQNTPGATSRPSNRDMRGTPYMGGRGMRSVSGGRRGGRGDRWVQVSRQGAGSGPQPRAPSMGGRGMGGGRMQGGIRRG